MLTFHSPFFFTFRITSCIISARKGAQGRVSTPGPADSSMVGTAPPTHGEPHSPAPFPGMWQEMGMDLGYPGRVGHPQPCFYLMFGTNSRAHSKWGAMGSLGGVPPPPMPQP